jgi:hypothetical protein
MLDGTSAQVTLMPTRLRVHEYHAATQWRVMATQRELAEITCTPEDLARWWPAAFLVVKGTGPSAEIRPGTEACCHVKGWLPHTLTFWGRVEDVVLGERFSVEVRGDFNGRMDCTVTQEGDYCLIEFDWRVYVHKPFVRRLSFLLKLLFYSNHAWVMILGLRSINRELARRRGELESEPPSPTFPYGPRSRWLLKWLSWAQRSRDSRS